MRKEMREFVNMLVRKLKLRGNAARFQTRYVPATAALVLVTFAPSVAATAPQVVTPPTKALTITRYAPVVTSGSFSLIVTPGTKALTITRHAPTVTVPTPQLVTPTTRALVITRYAPTAALSNALVVTPTTRALALIPRVPTITASNKQRVTPTTKALTLTRFVPIISSPGSGPKLVVPTTRALVAARFAPTVTATADRLVIPGKATRTITRYAPTITLGNVSGFFIAPGGNDSTGTGTQANPWRTLAKFYAQASPGDTLYCRGGTYSNWVKTTLAGTAGTDGNPVGYVWGVSGTAGNPITVKAYPGETPWFTGSSATANHFLAFTQGSSYHVIDGLKLSGFNSAGNAIFWIGNTSDTVDSHHVTIRNCHMTAHPTPDSHPHGVYFSARSRDITVEDNYIEGYVLTGPSGGAGVHAYHPPAGINCTVRRNIFTKWSSGVLIWDDAATVTIEHNTFTANTIDADLSYHSAITFRSNVSDGPVSQLPYDPNVPGSTTKSHNYANQTFTPTFGLTAGSPAINGAHDGTDAGAVDYP